MIAALLLAAGASRRFGSQKLLAPLDGQPLVRCAAERLSVTEIDDCIAVVGREGDAVRRALDGLRFRFVDNPRFADGLSSSLRAGVAALDSRCRAVIVALGDQPRVPPDVTPRLVAEWNASGASIVVPLYGGERGHPVLFDARVLDELLVIDGDTGARDVIARDSARVRAIETGLARPRDVDRPDDLAALLANG